MKKVKIFADTTCDLDNRILEEHDITLIPGYVIFGETCYKERKELSKTEFYELLEKSSFHPTTSQPTPQDFIESFEPYIKEGRDIVSSSPGTDLLLVFLSCPIPLPFLSSLNYDKLMN